MNLYVVRPCTVSSETYRAVTAFFALGSQNW